MKNIKDLKKRMTELLKEAEVEFNADVDTIHNASERVMNNDTKIDFIKSACNRASNTVGKVWYEVDKAEMELYEVEKEVISA